MEKLTKTDLKTYSNISPLLIECDNFDELSNLQDVVVINAEISSCELSILNGKNGLKKPEWYISLESKKNPFLLINQLDKIEEEEQEKFYEMLKYKTISNIDLPKNTKIVLLFKDLKKINKNILSLCLVLK